MKLFSFQQQYTFYAVSSEENLLQFLRALSLLYLAQYAEMILREHNGCSYKPIFLLESIISSLHHLYRLLSTLQKKMAQAYFYKNQFIFFQELLIL